MKNNHGRSRLNFILAFLLVAAMVVNDGILPFVQAGGFNTYQIKADDFSEEDAADIGDSSLFGASDPGRVEEKTSDQKELITSEGQNGISVFYTDAAGIPDNTVLKIRTLNQNEQKAYLDRAEEALNWTDPELTYVRLYDLVIENSGNEAEKYTPGEQVIVEIRLLDAQVMSQEQKTQFIKQNSELLDPNRTYTDLGQQFTEVRQKYVQQMQLENLQIISLGQEAETLETTTEDGVIRFKADKLYPYVLLMQSDDAEESSWDFNAGEDTAAVWKFTDEETASILEEMEAENTKLNVAEITDEIELQEENDPNQEDESGEEDQNLEGNSDEENPAQEDESDEEDQNSEDNSDEENPDQEHNSDEDDQNSADDPEPADGEEETTKTAVTVTIIGHSDTWGYDGQDHTVSGYDYEVSFDDIQNDFQDDNSDDTQDDTPYTVEDFIFTGTAKVTGRDADTWYMGLTSEQFENLNDNFKVTFEVTDGYLTIEPKPLTITAGSESKVYDGAPLTQENYTFDEVDLVAGDRIERVTVTGSQTTAGTGKNTPSDAHIINSGGIDVTSNYAVTYVDGSLTVTQRSLTITAGSAEKIYDGTALVENTYTIEPPLADGDTLRVTVTGSQTEAGTSQNVPSEAKIVNADDEDVTDSYQIQYENGTLTVTPSYTITWVNEDGTVLEQDQFVPDGTTPEYNGATPVKAPTEQYTYTFSKWEPEISEAKADITYKAVYTEALRKYLITWKNLDGSVLKTEELEYGSTPEYKGDTDPVYPSTDTGKQYVFSHWSPDIVPVTGDAEYTALYSSAVLEIFLHNGSLNKTPIVNAEFALFNDEDTDPERKPVWTGSTDEKGIVRLAKVDDENNQEELPEYERGASFKEGSSYTLKQMTTDTAQGYLVPEGSWTVRVDANGVIESKLIRNYVWPDYTTPEASDKYGIRFELTNEKRATLTYHYNIPEDAKDAVPPGPAEDKTEILRDLSFDLNYVIDVADPTAENYEFVGWLDENNVAVKYGETVILNTVITKEHVLEGRWRVPLNVSVMTYAGGTKNSAVKEIDGVFTTGEVVRNYTDLTQFCDDFGNLPGNETVSALNEGDEYEFVSAEIQPETGSAISIKALHYDISEHKWQYRKTTETNGWTDLSLGDQLKLYYAYNKVNVVWVKEENGNFTPLDEADFSEKTIQIDSKTGVTERDIYALAGTNAREAVVEKDSYFKYFGLGADHVDRDFDLIVGAEENLHTFTIKNSSEGFTSEQTADKDIKKLQTIYLVYSEIPPESSTRLNLDNYTKLDYHLEDITIDGVSLLYNYRAILEGELEGEKKLYIYDGGAGEKHARTWIESGDKIRLVLLDAASQKYTMYGGFPDTDEAESDYEVDIAIASADKNAVKHTLLFKEKKTSAGDIINELTDMNTITSESLDSEDGLVTITFDDDLAPFSIEKKWSVDAYPDALQANFDVYEIPNRSEDSLPDGFALGQRNEAQALREAGESVWQVSLSNVYANQKNGWNYKSQNLPKRNLYYAVENSIMRGNENETNRFQAAYVLEQLSEGGWRQTIINSRIDHVCQVGEVKFETIQRAVNYITSDQYDGTTAVIEMLGDYIMAETYVDAKTGVSESALVTIPKGYDITLTTAQDQNTATVSRGYSGKAMFTVEGKLTIENLKLTASQISRDNYYKGTENGGFVLVNSGAKLTVADGTSMTYGYAVNGSAVYIEDGGKAAFTGGTLTSNRSESGGAVGVGGIASVIELSGNTVINNNYPYSGSEQRNIYLNQDSEKIIQVVSKGLGEKAVVGVYVTDSFNNSYGKPAKPFAVYKEEVDDSSLNKLLNDRYRTSEAGKGYASELLENTVVWGETFDLTVNVEWLDEKYNKLNAIPADAEIIVTFSPENNKGFSTLDQEDLDLHIGENGVMQGTFRGLAKYNTNGSLCEYYVVQKKIVLPEDYAQIKFIGDAGVKTDAKSTDKDKNIPLKYNADLDAAGQNHTVTLYEHYNYTTFKIINQGVNLEADQTITSTFTLYGVKKGPGVSGVDDLPLGLRDADTPSEWSNVWAYQGDETVSLTPSVRFFQAGGGNQWYCQVSAGELTGEEMQDGITAHVEQGLVKFHAFYDYSRDLFTVDGDTFTLKDGSSWQPGDVIYYNGYQVYTGEGWYALTSDGTPEPAIQHKRQDGNGGVLGLGHDISGNETVKIPADTFKEDIYEGSLVVDKLSTEYYWYAVETLVTENGGQGRSLPSLEWLVAAYDPQYVYDQAEQQVTVINTLRNGVAVYKLWPEGSSGGTAHFDVYKVDLDQKPTDKEVLRKLIKGAYGEASGYNITEIPGMSFDLPEQGTRSDVHVVTWEELKADPTAVYFIKESESNRITVLGADIDEDGVETGQNIDCLYKLFENKGSLDLYTIRNLNEILCKVVDENNVEHVFRKLRDAYDYGKKNEALNKEFTIEMLKDYSIPVGDVLNEKNYTIESGMKVTITTADPDFTIGSFTYSGSEEESRAAITRNSNNTKSLFQVDAGGELILKNIILNGIDKNVTSGGIVNANKNSTVVLKSENGTKDTGVKIIHSSAVKGGALYVEGGSLEVSDAVFENCEATGDNGGGAINYSGISLKITNAEFIQCIAKTKQGGAVFHNNKTAGSSSVIKDSVFTECTAKTEGGALYSIANTVEIEESRFEKNHTETLGGAVTVNDTASSLTVKNSAFEGNYTASVKDKKGGAIYLIGKKLLVEDSIFTDNKAFGDGGSIEHYAINGTASKDTVSTLIRSEFYRSECIDTSNSSGGVMHTTAEKLVLTDCKFEDCFTPSKQGGAIQHYRTAKDASSATVTGCTFTRCKASSTGGTNAYGGGVNTDAFTAVFSGCTFENCEGRFGGAIANTSNNNANIGGSLEITDCTFTDCKVTTNTKTDNKGGAVQANKLTVNISSCAFHGCQSYAYGGGVSHENSNAGSTFTLENCEFTDCDNKGSGGGIYSTAETMTVSDAYFENCIVTGNGGGIYSSAKTLQVTDSEKGTETGETAYTFDHCTANYGGGIYHNNANQSEATIRNISFDTCTASYSGGGFRTDAVDANVLECLFDGCAVNKSNTSNQGGGGVYVTNTSLGTTTLIRQTTFKNCSAENLTSTSGGGVWTSSRTLLVEKGSRFENDHASGHGGGIYHWNDTRSAMTVTDTVFDHCAAGTVEGSIGTGGGIMTNVLNVNISDSTFTDCTAVGNNGDDPYGGGGAAIKNGKSGITTVIGTDFTRCEAKKGRGGAILCTSLLLTVERSEEETNRFTECKSMYVGGGLYHCQTVDGSRTEVTGYTFTQCESISSHGGGLQSDARELDLTDCALIKCHASTWGGGVNHNQTTSSVTNIRECSFDGCYAEINEGGGLRTTGVTVTVADSSFKDCYVSSLNGGGISHGNDNTNAVLTVNGTSFTNCYAEKGYGGGITTTVKTVTLSNTTMTGCHALTRGGGINHNRNIAGSITVIKDNSIFDSCYAVKEDGGGVRSNAKEMEISDTVFKNCYVENGYGGGLYHGEDKTNNSNTTTSTTVENSVFEDCYCSKTGKGGAIFDKALLLNLTGTTIDGCTDSSKERINAGYGGGIYNERGEAVLTDSFIQNCTAAAEGGGLYQYSTNNKPVTLSHTQVTGNKALNNGGGIYYGVSNSSGQVTLKRGTVITGNSLTVSPVPAKSENIAAGVYLIQTNQTASSTLIVGEEGLESDTITVWDNTLSDKSQSNVRLNSANPYNNTEGRYNNRSESVRLYSDLHDSVIGVVNPGIAGSQFGRSILNDHDGAGAFRSDDLSLGMTGRIDPTNTERIIWFQPPVCKITDEYGNILTYVSGDTQKIAVYNSLAAAIKDFNAGNTNSGHFYDGNSEHKDVWVEPAQIQMIRPYYPLSGADSSLPAFTRTVILTTSAMPREGEPEEYYYPKGANGTAEIVRGSDGGSMFHAQNNITVTISNLILDGGYAPDVSATLFESNENGGIINVNGAKVKLDQDAVLQNSKTSGNGGAVYLSGGASLEMTMNAQIADCEAANGGGIYIASAGRTGNYTVEMNYRTSITGCKADEKGGAIYVTGGASVNLDGSVDKITIKNNQTLSKDKNGGAGIYLAVDSSQLRLQGTLDFDNNIAVNYSFDGAENGAEPYVHPRQDIYLGSTSGDRAGSITVAGDIINGKGDDGFIWVWAVSDRHYKKDDQFAVIESGKTVQNFTVNAFRDAQDDATTGNDTFEYYLGVKGSNPNYIYWGVNIEDVSFLKTDKDGNPLKQAGFTVYTVTDSTNVTDLKVKLTDRSGKAVEPESDNNGVVKIEHVLRRGRTYYMKETRMPDLDAHGESANFGVNDKIYEISISTTGDVTIKVSDDGTSWTMLEKVNGTYVVKNEAIICKVVDQENVEHVFDTLNAAVNFIRGHSTAYVDGVATIQMLVDYTMPSTDRLTISGTDTIAFTTAHTAAEKLSRERYVYVGTNGDKALIRRGTGYNAGSMITVNGTGHFDLYGIVLDGQNIAVSANGSLIYANGESRLNVGADAILQNAKTSGNGAAVYTDASVTLTIEGAAFKNCNASGNGGAVYAKKGSLTLGGEQYTSTFTDCSAGGDGGSIYLDAPELTAEMKNMQISGSGAANGGAIALSTSKKTVVTLDGVTILNTKADSYGGGIYLQNSSTSDATELILKNTQIGALNRISQAGLSGGGIYSKANRMTLELSEDSVIRYSRSTSVNSNYGGGAAAHVPVTYNGNCYFTLTGVGEAKGGRIENCVSSSSGGGLDIHAYTVTLKNITVDSCDSEGGAGTAGGGIYLRKMYILQMDSCMVNGCNSATNGGGIWMSGGSTNATNHSRITNTAFTACTANKTNGMGGGIFVNSAAIKILKTTFSGCSVGANGLGGGISTNNCTVTVDEDAFLFCSGNGGGAYFENSEANVVGSRFVSCTGSNYGGGIRVKGKKNNQSLTIGDKILEDSYLATEFRGCKAPNGVSYGSAIRIEDGGVATVTGHTLITMRLDDNTDPETVRGCAVYVAGGGLLNFGANADDTPSITDYRLSGANDNGAGIYLGFSSAASYGKLTLQGSPVFRNNLSGKVYKGKLGGADYDGRVNQDIYIDMTGYDNVNKNMANVGRLDAITVKGELTSPNGIWVFVSNDKNNSSYADGHKHYLMGDQFGIAATEEISDETLALFKNARLDEETGNVDAGSVLQGVRGAQTNWVYWGSLDGFDVSFKKIDGFGNALAGAKFVLYQDKECTEAFQTNQTEVSAVSADGKTDKDIMGSLLEEGQVLFEKVPAGAYYMKEANGASPLQTEVDGTVFTWKNEKTYVVLVGEVNLSAGNGLLVNVTEEQLEAQRGSGSEKRDFAIFLSDSSTGQAAVSSDIADFGIMNESDQEHKIVLKKIGSSYEPLEDAHFRIFRADMSEVTEGQESGKTFYVSYATGVYFIGDLPDGIYYLAETKAPKAADYSGNLGKIYKLTISGSNISEPEVFYQAEADDTASEKDIVDAFRSWMIETLKKSNQV